MSSVPQISKRQDTNSACERTSLNHEQSKDFTHMSAIDQAILAASDPRFNIIYLFPHPKQDLDKASPFGWYTPGILATAEPMRQACELPADIREAHTDIDVVLVHRLAGTTWPHLLPIEIDSFEQSLEILQSPFIVCVTTDVDVAASTDLVLKDFPIPVLHVSSVSAPNRVPPQGFNLHGVCVHVRKVLDALSRNTQFENFVRECRRLLTDAPQRKLRKHPLPLGMHNVTAPNETALAAFGYKFPTTRRISEPFGPMGESTPEKYISRICQAADAVAAERARLLSGRTPLIQDHRAIIAVASSYARLYSTWQDLVQRVPGDKRRELRQALGFVTRSESYFHSVPSNSSGELALSPIAELVSRGLARDMRAFTSALSMLSSATLCPVLRLEPKINGIRVQAAELARCVRTHAEPAYHRKQARMMRVLGEKMRSLIDHDFLKRIDGNESRYVEGLKLITDLPLELLPSNGMPLGLRFDISRVSPVPGNLFWQTCNLPPLRISVNAFYDVLVVRSFDASDPIGRHLEKALKVVDRSSRFKRLRYRFVDVDTPEQFVEAIQDFNGAVLIFDGHGRYDSRTGVGRLVVGGKPLDTWALKRRCQLPPVVMFSACDTQPIEGSHGSVATSAFALGARAVLGTMFPVNAVHSSVMMARMLLRIDQFLPIAITLFPIVNWRHVVSGMLRMSHVTEAARTLNKRAQLGLAGEALSRIQLLANNEINSWSSRWFDAWVDALASESARSSDEIRRLISLHVGITDAMKYVHLGNPERLIISG